MRSVTHVICEYVVTVYHEHTFIIFVIVFISLITLNLQFSMSQSTCKRNLLSTSLSLSTKVWEKSKLIVSPNRFASVIVDDDSHSEVFSSSTIKKPLSDQSNIPYISMEYLKYRSSNTTLLHKWKKRILYPQKGIIRYR